MTLGDSLATNGTTLANSIVAGGYGTTTTTAIDMGIDLSNIYTPSLDIQGTVRIRDLEIDSKVLERLLTKLLEQDKQENPEYYI